jgi:primosomal protein N' (replication factor Y)
MFVRVTFPISRFQTFTYSVPQKLQSTLQRGACVQASMGKRTLIGYVLSVDKNSSYNGKIKDILNIHESDLQLPQDLWNTLEWMSKYYISPMGQVLKSAIPQSFMDAYSPQLVKYVQITPDGESALASWDSKAYAQYEFLMALSQVDEPIRLSTLSEIVSSPHSISTALEKKGFIKTVQQAKVYDPFDMMIPGEVQEITLSTAQNAVFTPIKEELNNGKYSPFLLHGVTGSGKTEVYLKLAQEVVNNGGTVLVLVPEISLTPQVAKRFRRAFGARVALWHSKMTKAEKGWTWQQLKKGNYSVVVGARSAMFAPLNNLQLIIVDEEQESSYKQESPSPRYHARDVALIRGKFANATVLLTSATPSLESHYNSIKNKLSHLKLSERFGESIYPQVKLVDMKNESNFGEETPILSDVLKGEIEHCLQNKEQIILLQNRRGFSLIQQCEECGHISTCNHCAVSLTYHRSQQKLICHYCKFETQILHTCGECNGDSLQLKGSGTQHVEEVIGETFPNARVLRMDVDTVQKRGAHHKILQQFEEEKADILLGTQMIAKGLDFPNVTLVGIINADSGLFLPDFRAGERTFQLLYQVCGRSGRHTKPGKAVIQTFNPQDPYIQSAAQLNIQKFYSIALAQRQELSYPPFSRISRILISGKNQHNVNSISSQISAKLQLKNKDFQILGPVPAPIERIRENWRNHIIIKSTATSASKIHTFIYNVLGVNVFEGVQKGVRVQIDMDPVSML